MTCDEARAALAAGEAADGHAEACADCRSARDDYRDVDARLKEAFAGARPPGSLEGRILNDFETRRARPLGWFYATAATVLLASFVAFVVWPRAQRDSHRFDPKPDSIVALQDAFFEGSLLSRGTFLARLGPYNEARTPAGTLKSRHAVVKVTVGRKKDKVTNETVPFVVAFVMTGMVTLTNDAGACTAVAGESIYSQSGEAPARHIESLGRRFGAFFEAVDADVKPAVPTHALPVDLSTVVGYDTLAPQYDLAKDEPLLARHAMVVTPLPRWLSDAPDNLFKAYEEMPDDTRPLLVTADSVLFLYHTQFDETLRMIEEAELLSAMTDLTRKLVDYFAKVETDEARLALKHFAVALTLFEPSAEIPADIRRDVDPHVEWVKACDGTHRSTIFGYEEDFTHYKPRGHYSRIEKMRRYFRGMTWLGRMTLLLKGGEDAIVPKEVADRHTRAACAIARAMEEEKLWGAWERVYGVTAFFAGLADDLGPREYLEALETVGGEELDEKALERLRIDLALHGAPSIYGGTGGTGWLTDETVGDNEKLLKALDKTTGFRFMGQRFVPDSYVMGRLIYPTVGKATHGTDAFTCLGEIRAFPRGLDVMAVLETGGRAREILRETRDDRYLKYDAVLTELRGQFDEFKEPDWNRNLYWSWLYALKAALHKFGGGHPTFMTTKAYATKSVNTALASWAQLRHDTILYVKPTVLTVGSAVPMPRPPPVHYVEPNAALYARLLALTRMTRRGLEDFKAMPKSAGDRLKLLDAILEKLVAISIKELRHEAPTKEENAWIAEFGATIRPLAGSVPVDSEPAFKTSVIADVHTEPNSGQVLEVGTGNLEVMTVVFLAPDGKLHAASGPVQTYYEFKHPSGDRLTDEGWRAILKAGPPGQPEWTKEFRK